MKLAGALAVVVVVCILAPASHAKKYYVDSGSGSDRADGTSPLRAWQSLTKVNATAFQPGDQILFRAGRTWQGQLKPATSGSAGHLIVFGRYGTGPRPHIDGSGLVDDVVYLHNVQQIEIGDLEITNWADEPAIRRGVDISAQDFGVASHIIVADLYIHDIRGTLDRKENGGIIFRTQGSQVPTRFDGLRIERNIIWKVDRSGIAANSYATNRDRWFPSTKVVIRDNFIDDIGGDGIVPWATEHAIVEHNIVLYCNHRRHGL